MHRAPTFYVGTEIEGAIMKFTDQDRQCFVTLSAAKGLSRWADRCEARAQHDSTGFDW